MITEIVQQTTPIFLGIPQSNQPKFRIGDYVRHRFDWGIGYEPMEQVGRVTAILAYETEPGNPKSITANYTYIVSSSSHHPHMIGQEDDASEDELELA